MRRDWLKRRIKSNGLIELCIRVGSEHDNGDNSKFKSLHLLLFVFLRVYAL